MNNLAEVLRQKETEVVRLRREIGALRLVIPLLAPDAEDIGQDDNSAEAGGSLPIAAERGRETQFPADSQEVRSRSLIAKSFGDIQSLAHLLRTKWAKVKKEEKAA